MPNTTASPFRLAQRCTLMNPSILREILKVTERPDIISLAGGLPSAALFPVEAIRDAAHRVLSTQPGEALQYAPSEGFGPLREWIAARLQAAGMAVEPGRILVTNGSQQALDLVARVMIDAGAPVLVESPTYLGALQAFTPFEPRFRMLAADDAGPLPEALAEPGYPANDRARFAYLIPDFQNPTGRSIPAPRRQALARAAIASNAVIVEDNPYGELWYDEAPPRPIAASAPAHTLYLGSLSKVLAPGLRLGYLVAPPVLYPKLLQAKQAADLHTAGLPQRIAADVLGAGLLDVHLPRVREHYRVRRDAMARSLATHMGDLADWTVPAGGMFFWVRLRVPLDTLALLEAAVVAGVAFVPGRPFYGDGITPVAAEPARDEPVADADRTMRLSFVTVTPEAIDDAINRLAGVIRQRLEATGIPAKARAAESTC